MSVNVSNLNNSVIDEGEINVEKNQNDFVINNESIIHEKNINVNDITDLTINQDEIVKKQEEEEKKIIVEKHDIILEKHVIEIDGKKEVKIIEVDNRTKNVDGFMLENVNNIEGLIKENKLPQINENNFDDQSMIKIEDQLHQQMDIDVANQGILNNNLDLSINKSVDENFIKEDQSKMDVSGFFEENLPFSKNNENKNEKAIKVGEYNSINDVNDENIKK